LQLDFLFFCGKSYGWFKEGGLVYEWWQKKNKLRRKKKENKKTTKE